MRLNSISALLALSCLYANALACGSDAIVVNQTSTAMPALTLSVRIDNAGCVTVQRSSGYAQPGVFSMQLTNSEWSQIANATSQLPAFSQTAIDSEVSVVASQAPAGVLDGDLVSVWIAPASRGGSANSAQTYAPAFYAARGSIAPQHVAFQNTVLPIAQLAFNQRLLPVN
jgi:hypothetical protein